MKSGKKTHSKIIIITAVVLAMLCATCLDPFPLPDLGNGNLVVEARFTDDPEANRVILSFAGKVNESDTLVTGANVYVTDDMGGTVMFEESENGFYLPELSGSPGIAGRKYVLHIELEDGRIYRSDECILRDVPPIEELSWDIAQNPSPDNTQLLNGVEFKLDTYDPENQVRNFLWTYDEVWEEAIPYPISEVYLGDNEFEYIYNSSRCFMDNISSEVMIKSTNDQEESLIRDYPIVFVSNESARLFRRYRIKVRQFGLSDEAYFYHNQLKEITSQTGSIFDKQPFSLFGNIRNVEDPSEMVMGYFIVSGVSTRTITITPSVLPPEYRALMASFKMCSAETYNMSVTENSNFDRIFYRQLPRWDLAFVTRLWELSPMGEDILVGLLFAPPECTECYGNTEKPENWDSTE
jgi:hypothetical protein